MKILTTNSNVFLVKFFAVLAMVALVDFYETPMRSHENYMKYGTKCSVVIDIFTFFTSHLRNYLSFYRYLNDNLNFSLTSDQLIKLLLVLGFPVSCSSCNKLLLDDKTLECSTSTNTGYKVNKIIITFCSQYSHL